ANVGWTFTLDNNSTVLQSLALGQTITQVYTVTVTDNNGASVPQDVTITITGVNDGPVIISGAANHQGGVTEDADGTDLDLLPDAVQSTGGTITFRDIDLIDTHTASFVLKSSNVTDDVPGFNEGTGTAVAIIGTFALTPATVDAGGHVVESTDVINTANVGWSFTLPDNDPLLQALAKDGDTTPAH